MVVTGPWVEELLKLLGHLQSNIPPIGRQAGMKRSSLHTWYRPYQKGYNNRSIIAVLSYRRNNTQCPSSRFGLHLPPNRFAAGPHSVVPFFIVRQSFSRRRGETHVGVHPFRPVVLSLCVQIDLVNVFSQGHV